MEVVRIVLEEMELRRFLTKDSWIHGGVPWSKMHNRKREGFVTVNINDQLSLIPYRTNEKGKLMFPTTTKELTVYFGEQKDPYSFSTALVEDNVGDNAAAEDVSSTISSVANGVGDAVSFAAVAKSFGDTTKHLFQAATHGPDQRYELEVVNDQTLKKDHEGPFYCVLPMPTELRMTNKCSCFFSPPRRRNDDDDETSDQESDECKESPQERSPLEKHETRVGEAATPNGPVVELSSRKDFAHKLSFRIERVSLPVFKTNTPRKVRIQLLKLHIPKSDIEIIGTRGCMLGKDAFLRYAFMSSVTRVGSSVPTLYDYERSLGDFSTCMFQPDLFNETETGKHLPGALAISMKLVIKHVDKTRQTADTILKAARNVKTFINNVDDEYKKPEINEKVLGYLSKAPETGRMAALRRLGTHILIHESRVILIPEKKDGRERYTWPENATPETPYVEFSLEWHSEEPPPEIDDLSGENTKSTQTTRVPV